MDNTQIFTDLVHDAFYVIILASAPILIPSLLIGLLLGMLQAATSINESTLTFVPKLIALCLCLYFFGPFIGNTVHDYTLRIFETISMVSS
jgi:flagellar biosynthetic protein FliQ